MGPGEEIDNAEEEVPCQCEVLLSLESTRSASLGEGARLDTKATMEKGWH